MKRQIPVLLAFLTGTFVVVAFFVSAPVVVGLNEKLDELLMIVTAFALPLGVVSFLQHHSKKIGRRSIGWRNSIVSVASFAVMASLGIVEPFVSAQGRAVGFNWLFDTVFTPLQATMFSLLAFMIASAAFRAFRVKNLEAAILMISAVIVMLGRVPIGKFVLPPSAALTEWIMNVPNLAAQRGILIGAALGAASMAIRIILGIERPYMGGAGE
ncbi:hypothetical protein JXA88_04185 [Candidatus Fermentibacteria bacterium]|nr:hypothetical protein [Candidatus Fermentibacteria bacterium]